MTLEFGRRLLASGALSSSQLQAAIHDHVTAGVALMRALIDHGALSDATIEKEISRNNIPILRSVAPALQVVNRLPLGMCSRLLAVPVRVDPVTSTIDVATADPFDIHLQAEFSYQLDAPIRVIYAQVSVLEQALRGLEPSPQTRRIRDNRPFPETFDERIHPPSDMPIPLVRRSRAPSLAPGLKPVDLLAVDEDQDEEEEDELPTGGRRITRDAFVIDPGGKPPGSNRPARGPTSEGSLGLEATLTALEHARGRDAVVQALIAGMLAVAGRVGIFAVRKASFQGWGCSGSLGPEDTFRSLRISRSRPSIFAEAAGSGWYLGPLPFSPPHDRLLSWMGHVSDELALVAVKVAGKPVMLILADELRDTMIATRTGERLARGGGEALARIIRGEKRPS